MEGGDVKLVGQWESHFTLRAAIALNLKGIQYEFLEEAFGAKSELLLSSNPIYKKMPVLIHGAAEKPLCESMIIVQYVDEVWSSSAPSILPPSDPYDRAVARFWANYVDDKFFPALYGIFKSKTEEGRVEAAEQTIAILHILEEAFEKYSKGMQFFGGDTIGYVDIALGCSLGWIGAAEQIGGIKILDEAKLPHLVCWAERFRSSDAVKGVLLETHKFVEYAKKLKLLLSIKSTE